MIIAPTHYFMFEPNDKNYQLYDFAMKSEYLYKPENACLNMFPVLIAGLEEKDLLRLKLYCFTDIVIGEIFTCVPENGKKLPEDMMKRNEAALDRVRKFTATLYDKGFSEEDIQLIKGASPMMKHAFRQNNVAIHS